MKHNLVSTIIPVYNRPEMLLEAVQSVLAQSYSPLEIIIVNDGSTDSTQATIDQLTHKHSHIKSIEIANSGPGLARQAGLDMADGEFIQFLDSDDLIFPEKFSKQVQGLRSEPSLGVSYCLQEYRNINGALLDSAWMRTGEYFKTMFPAMLGGRIWATPTPLYRANLLKRIGPWKDLKNQEDWEYDCRVAHLGVKLHYIAEPLVVVRAHHDSHFGQISEQQSFKLADKARAYLSIYQHARLANVPATHSEAKRFARMSFLLARQCAIKGLIVEAKSLIEICKDSATTLVEKAEYSLYSILSNIIGWQNLAKLATRALG